jgi:hypothetical protein
MTTMLGWADAAAWARPAASNPANKEAAPKGADNGFIG